MFNLGIRSKLILGFLIVVILLIVTTVLGINSLNRVVAIEEATLLAHEIKIQILECRVQEEELILHGALPVNVIEWRQSFNRLNNSFRKLTDISNVNPDEFERITGTIVAYNRLFDKFLREIRGKAIISIEESKAYSQESGKLVSIMQNFSNKIIQDSLLKRSELEASTYKKLGWVSVLAILFSLLLAFIVVLAVKRAMLKEEQASQELQESSMDLALGLSELFEVLRKVAQGNLTLRVPENFKNELLSKLGRTINTSVIKMLESGQSETEQIYNLISSGIRVLDKDCNVIRSNQALKNLSLLNEDMPGLKCYDQLRSERCFTEFCTIKQIFAGKEKIEIEEERLNARGEKVSLLLRAVPYKDAQGNLIGVLQEFVDITKLKNYESGLELISKDLSVGLSEVFEMAKKLILGDVTFRVTSKSKNELLTKLFSTFNQVAETMENMIEYEHEMVMGICEHFDVLTKVSLGDLSVRAPENSKLELVAKLGSLINKEILGLLELIKTQKDMQEQLVHSEKMVSVGMLAGGVAHEINNPLATILNNVKVIKMMTVSKKTLGIEEFASQLDSIERSAQRCSMITRTLLDFSRPSKGVFVPCSLNAIINTSVELIENDLNLKNILIQKELNSKIPQIIADQQLLQQVVFNIFNNARWAVEKKFKNQVGGIIKIETEHNSETKEVLLSISDNGIGIKQEFIGRLFEPFFSTKDVGEGTGLGLSIVYGIIKKHNGAIDVESQVGQGTVFKITFPEVDNNKLEIM